MSVDYDVLIVGAGHGGASTAVALRQQRFEGTIGLLGEEPELPYDRPPLSKDYLNGDKPWESMVFHSAKGWADRQVDLMLGCQVLEVDASAHRVHTKEGRSINYGKLVWAAGGMPRRLACDGHDLAGVHTLRARADADRMIAELPSVHEAVVVGGGYIGLEAAAALRTLGKKVTLLEALDRVLARVTAEPVSRFYEAQHRSHGVDIRLDAKVDRIIGKNERVTGVRLADGEEIPAQMVIVGIGISPVVAPLITAGAAGSNGVRVDAQCRTSLPDILALGDCAEHRNSHGDDDWIRIESVQNATDQGTIAAQAIMGEPCTYDAVPWFWSDQYDLKLQTVGLSHGHDQYIVRGFPETGSFAIVYLRSGVVIALDCVNAIRDYAQGRMLVRRRARPDPALLADPAVELRALA